LKRLSRNINKTKIPGSLTIETALVLPIFMYAIITFIYFLQIIGIYEDIQYAITETGYYTAKYAYVYDYILHYKEDSQEEQATLQEEQATLQEEQATLQEEQDSLLEEQYALQEEQPNSYKEQDSLYINNNIRDLESSLDAIIANSINSTYYKLKMRDYIKEERLNQSCIQGGYEGIQTYLSTFMKDDNFVDIIVVYRVKLPLLFFDLDSFPVIQRVRMRGWNGYRVAVKNSDSDSSEKNESVYITEHGSVYHITKECTHLTFSIQEINVHQINQYRNESGGKYNECRLCDSNVTNSYEQVFITKTGNRYHYSLTCSGLKRNIITISISNIGERNLCSRCGKLKE
jgi:hypothetical protein